MTEKSRRYTDFAPTEKPNTIWTFEKGAKGQVTFEKVHCAHAISGDTDSVTGDTLIWIDDEQIAIEDFYFNLINEGGEFKVLDPENHNYVFSPRFEYKARCSKDGFSLDESIVSYIMRHKVNKMMFEVECEDEYERKTVRITEDHSIMILREGELISVKPMEVQGHDRLVSLVLGGTVEQVNSFTIRSLGKMDIWVYDIEVEEVHNFFANDILVHNSCYCKFPHTFTEKAGIDEIVKAADTVAKRVNDAYPAFLEAAFNCPKSRNDSMVSERECVADAALIVTKKRYAMHIIDDEGERVDKIKIMGLEIKKADTSPMVKKILKTMVEKILAGDDRKELNKTITEFKKEFYSADPKEIALPCGCKTLAKLQRQLKETGDMKGGHYVSRAAIFYNSLCDNRDTLVRAGDKVGLLYIDHPQSKYIGFPRDAAMLPEWLDDIQVDYDMMWEKAEKKITNYLKSMGWDYASIRKSHRQELFGF